MSKVIRLIDRTRTVQDWKCPRSRYLGYELMGKGIVKKGTSIELFMGITLHDAFAHIAEVTYDGGIVDIDLLAKTSWKQMFDHLMQDTGDTLMGDAIEFANEQATLVEGIVRGFYKHSWPRLMNGHKIVKIEAENEFFLDGEGQFVFMTKPDLLLENEEGDLVYVEYKSTSSKKDKWINSWDTAVQLHSSIKAVEATLGRKPAYVQIVGMYKGYESYGKQSSPFCYAYKKAGNPPFTKDQIEYAYKAGFRRYATWELPGGVKSWIDGMPENILADQFPQTPMIMVNDDLVNAFFRQRLSREISIKGAVDALNHLEDPTEHTAVLDDAFPQHFDQCVPSFGYPCSYRKICHGEVKDPLNEGYEFRTPHHAREMEAQDDPAK